MLLNGNVPHQFAMISLFKKMKKTEEEKYFTIISTKFCKLMNRSL